MGNDLAHARARCGCFWVWRVDSADGALLLCLVLALGRARARGWLDVGLG